MKLAFYILFFITVTGIIWLIFDRLYQKDTSVKERLTYVRRIRSATQENEYSEPFYQRIIKPILQNIMKGIGRLAPVQIKERYSELIIMAGEKSNATFNSVFITQLVMAFAVGMIAYAGTSAISGEGNLRITLLLGGAGFLLPILLLYNSAKKRKDKIRRELPDFLDLLYISVEAGLGFDLALKKSADKMGGVFSQEVTKTMVEITRGRNREEAFRGLEKRTGIEEVSSFVISVIQTERLGSNIANMLKTQSVTMRQKRRQVAEEKAATMSVKMTFPMVLFIFPALFVIIIGPAIINIVQQFISQY